MVSPVSPVKVDLDVSAEKSCNNWRCCFGWCKSVTIAPKEKDSPDSVSITTTIEKTVRTFETHHEHKHSSGEK